MRILMVAAENDALPGGKVGGIGDVVRDIPAALGADGHQVQVVTPGYGAFSRLSGATAVGELQVRFRGRQEQVRLLRVPAKAPRKNVTQWILEHPLFAIGGEGRIYCDDPCHRPFATDASKFALFCAAVATAVVEGAFSRLDVLHLHDWHTALVAVLRAFDPGYRQLRFIHTVYTIHNLALQGIRPFDGDESSLRAWFPELHFAAEQISDPRDQHCINPMRAGVNLSDTVHAVSPSYAQEIQRPSDPQHGFYGGEGLQDDLRRAAGEGRLHGILNGCEYPRDTGAKLPLADLLRLCEDELLNWVARNPEVASAHLIASRRLARWFADLAGPALVITSVGRLTDQKVLLLRQVMADGRTALEHLLSVLGKRGIFILLGSGDPRIEQILARVAAQCENFLFLKGYSEAVSAGLYASGDLFLMPSSFEPCGISQMLAMRAGQPCLVHSVGGLRDTVADERSGFAFMGDNPGEQAQHMIARFTQALETRLDSPERWQAIVREAAAARFLWSDVARELVATVYRRS
ncbi:glycosyltransferase [Seongchinamella sediminis]|uniref:starch synthase n=1 Tax=Seongchinamella sediminis TaxID=2283635 RepID=A0A3L7DZ37_9GAMM|nr:glycogen/starch synthase [Seongchinamella sediminis]RLQ22486.1 glycosyltransferase [Seongchinamella sediminis]